MISSVRGTRNNVPTKPTPDALGTGLGTVPRTKLPRGLSNITLDPISHSQGRTCRSHKL